VDPRAPLTSGALRRLLRMPPGLIQRVAGPSPHVDGRTLDPALALMVKGNPRGSHATDPATRRQALRRDIGLVMPPVGGVAVEAAAAHGPRGPIPLRVYRSHHGSAQRPVIVYYHGGGWVVGDLDTADGTCRMLALHSGCIVVSVDYRLAPEHPFPAPLDDAVAAFHWALDHSEQLGRIRDAVAVMGESAGANLAASVCLSVRGAGPTPLAQSLVYPATDLRMGHPSVETFAEGFLLEKQDMQWFVQHYLPDAGHLTHPLASPLLADDLSGLPPACVFTAGFDPLRDEGAAYARRLSDAGVDVRYRCFDDQVHGFLALGVLPGGMARIASVCRDTGRLVRGAAGR
jgi:acetyl esterase